MRIETGAGPAKVQLALPPAPTFLLALTHGAGGDPDTPDLLAVRDAAQTAGGAVALVTQPYRVAGRRAPGSTVIQDAAWLEIMATLRRKRALKGVPIILGGRSNGARVACRTAVAAGASGVIALAFPLHPPGRPEKSRADELRSAGTEVLVVNGANDPFGIPDAGDAALVHVIAGQAHALRGGLTEITETVTPWLRRWRARAPLVCPQPC